MSDQQPTSARRSIFTLVPRWEIWGAIAVVAIIAIAVAVALVQTSKPMYFAEYHSLKSSEVTLQSSVHRGIACGQCHQDPRGDVVYEISLVGEFYRGLFGKPRNVTFVKLAKPSRRACLSCHTHDWAWNAERTSKVPHPAHLSTIGERRDCVSCHRWTAHEEGYMQKHKAMPFSTVCASFGCHVGWKQIDECSSCHHSLQESKGEWKTIHPQTVRASGSNQCLETCHTADQCRQCHTTGVRPAFNSGGVTGVTQIEREHVKKTWVSKHGAFALADQSKCLVCHVSEAECKDCHSKRPAFHGPQSSWLGRHKNLAKNKQRCLTCHDQTWCDACHKQFKEMR